jgi:uncharacterized lipoprotein YehR (DUF1307 family)
MVRKNTLLCAMMARFPIFGVMKHTLLLIALVTAFACNNPEKEKKNEASGAELLNIYADSLSLVADSLEGIYNGMIKQVAMQPNKTDSIKLENKDEALSLEKRMDELNGKILGLLEEKKISDQDYQEVAIDLDLTGVSDGMEKLRLLGIDYQEK